MDRTTAKVAELKQIVHDVLGTVASEVLLKRVYAVLDEEHKDSASLEQACIKIEKMVSLFIGADKTQTLTSRFARALDEDPAQERQ